MPAGEGSCTRPWPGELDLTGKRRHRAGPSDGSSQDQGRVAWEGVCGWVGRQRPGRSTGNQGSQAIKEIPDQSSFRLEQARVGGIENVEGTLEIGHVC